MRAENDKAAPSVLITLSQMRAAPRKPSATFDGRSTCALFPLSLGCTHYAPSTESNIGMYMSMPACRSCANEPGNAHLAGLEKTLDLRDNDFNTLLSIFYNSDIPRRIPMTYLTKYIGPGWVLPLTTLLFGTLTLAFAFVKYLQQAAAVRILLSVFEAGIFDGRSYCMSRSSKRSKLAIRLSLYIGMAPLGGAVSVLLASGILKLDHFGSTKGWQMVFAIEVANDWLGNVGFDADDRSAETVRLSFKLREGIRCQH